MTALCVFVCPVPGVRGADEAELRRIVSEPHEEHLLRRADYSLLETILPKLSRRVCFTASEPPLPVKTSQPGGSIHIQFQNNLTNLHLKKIKDALILTAVYISRVINCSLQSTINMINSSLLSQYALTFCH